ncbi:MAG: Gfo/Idh/MocA family oxidoreductase [Gemmatimonadetes bacterium]|nr:Gfo/Idh/MocA family oxidoreductase [Gemmatimonadota bacterium]
MARTVTVGILGTGAITQTVHLPVLSQKRDVVVKALSDMDRGKARALAERYRISAVLQDDELFRHGEIDAILICTPNHQHEQQAVAALEAGKHVMVEKPLAFTRAGIDRVIAAAKAANRSVMVAMNNRYRSDTRAVRAFLAGGELGQVFFVRGGWLNQKVPVARATWRQRSELAGGGALMDLGVQTLDLCFWLIGYPRVKRVSAFAHRGEFEVEDSAVVLAEAGDNIVVSVEVTWNLFSGRDRHYAYVLGSHGSATLPPLAVFKDLGGRPADVTPVDPAPERENPYKASYRSELEHFLRVVRGDEEAVLPVEQATLMAVVEAAYQSMQHHQEVVL